MGVGMGLFVRARRPGDRFDISSWPCVYVWAWLSIGSLLRCTGQKFEMQREGCRGVSPIPDHARAILVSMPASRSVLDLGSAMHGA